MTLEIMAFALGGLLLLTGILGGAFDLKGIKIPKVGTVPRLFAALAGLLLIVLGSEMEYNFVGAGGDNGKTAIEDSANTMAMKSFLDDIRHVVDHKLDEALAASDYEKLTQHASRIENQAQGILEAAVTLDLQTEVNEIKDAAHDLKHAAEERKHEESHHNTDMLKQLLDDLEENIHEILP